MSQPFDHKGFLESMVPVPWEGTAESGRILYAGPQASELLGYPAEAWSGPTFWEEKIFPDDQAGVAAARARLTDSGGSHVIDYRMEHADGRIVWICESATLVTGPHGSPTIRGTLLDITDRKRREVALWKSEERLRALLRCAPDAMILTDAEGAILNMNDQAEAMMGYNQAEVIGSSIQHLVPDRLRPRLPGLLGAFRRDPERRSLVDGHGFAVLQSMGVELPVELSMSTVLSKDEARPILWSLRDLTARRRVEAELRSSERRLGEMADVLPPMVCLVDTAHRYRFINDAYAHWNGAERRTLEGRLVREVLGEALYAEMKPSIDAALSGVAKRFRREMEGPGKRHIPVDVSVVPQWDESGAVSGCVLVIVDSSASASKGAPNSR